MTNLNMLRLIMSLILRANQFERRAEAVPVEGGWNVRYTDYPEGVYAFYYDDPVLEKDALITAFMECLPDYDTQEFEKDILPLLEMGDAALL